MSAASRHFWLVIVAMIVASFAGCAALQQATQLLPPTLEENAKHGRCLSAGFSVTVPPFVFEQLTLSCVRAIDGGTYAALNDAGEPTGERP